MSNHLYYGDNLAVLRDSIPDESVDLIYLDPPFNSNASYNVLFKGPAGNESAAQIEAFDDTWHWTDAAEEAFGEVLRSGNGAAAEMLRAMRSFLGENDMMAVRLLEFYRVVKTKELPLPQAIHTMFAFTSFGSQMMVSDPRPCVAP
jgi:site-specific DNA-methyltransferase (adenine-specific)